MKSEPTNYPNKRSLINAVLYLVDNGCKWRALPHDFPPYSTVHSFYRRARISGFWEKVLDSGLFRRQRKKIFRECNQVLEIQKAIARA